MTTIEPGQVWEVYSRPERRWVPAVVFKMEDGHAVLRYEGTLEFVTVDIDDMRGRPELFRPAIAAENP